jgi:hypothetical protein
MRPQEPLAFREHRRQPHQLPLVQRRRRLHVVRHLHHDFQLQEHPALRLVGHPLALRPAAHPLHRLDRQLHLALQQLRLLRSLQRHL